MKKLRVVVLVGVMLILTPVVGNLGASPEVAMSTVPESGGCEEAYDAAVGSRE